MVGPGASPRPRLSLDGIWQFWVDPGTSLTLASLDARQATNIKVPAPWQSQSPDLRSYCGVAWYRRDVEIPADWIGQSIILHFGAVDYIAEVWLNEVKIGQHEGGYLPFEFDVTGAAHRGTNTLTLRVADPTDLAPEIPHGKQTLYGPLSGIWQSVWIECRPDTHLVSLRITPHKDRVQAAVALSRPLAPDHSLTYEILSPDGQVCASAVSRDTNISLSVSNPLLWDIATPNLYSLSVTIHGNSTSASASDVLSDYFGFRTVETRNEQIYLNGRPIYLRGALDQDYYPDLICTPPSFEYIEAQFRQAKAMGLNCLRVHIKVADPRYYAAADRVGLLIWTELPNWSYLTPAAIQRARETLEGAIRRDWNHPSIVAWTIVNEAWGTEIATNPDHRAWLADMHAWVKTLDPTRLVVDNSACSPNFHVRSDLDDYHFYAGMPDGAQRWDALVRDFARRPDWLYAPDYQPQASEDGRTWNGGQRNPLLVTEFGNWGLPDIGPLRQHYGGEPWWFETGWDLVNGEVYPHAADQRFSELQLGRVFGDYAGLARASQWAQFEALKYQIETMRLYPSITGYVLTQFTDVHWECNGLLDMLRRPKAHFGHLADLNADTLVIARAARYAFWAGETIDVELHLSHFGPTPIAQARLAWSLSGTGVSIWGSPEGEITAEPATVLDIPALTLVAPSVEAPTSARLHLNVVDASGAVITHYFLDLSLFPREPAPAWPLVCPDVSLAESLSRQGYRLVPPDSGPSAAALVLTRLDGAARRLIEQGGRAIFLAEVAEALATSVPHLHLSPRQGTTWQGDWACTFAWYRRDQFAQSIPGDGRLDFSFAAVIPETVMGWSNVHDFEHEILAGIFVGWLRRPAALIRKFPVGRGTLLVCTLRLKDNIARDPVAAVLFRELVRAIS